MHTVTVELAAGNYPILIERHLLKRSGQLLHEHLPASRAAVISDDGVAGLYGQSVADSLQAAGCRCQLVTFAAGEASKNLATVRKLYDPLFEIELDRRCPIVALGGGVVGDTAGFVAATFLRGVPFVQIPTTLLAMVDASVGGKVGVNHTAGKNMIGAFYQPRLVMIDPECLRSLPEAQLRSGLAECVKHAVIRDPAIFKFIEGHTQQILALEPTVCAQLIGDNCRIKADVVSADERESRLRMILNFGHTAGHAIETLGRYRELLHGEAVSIGMALAAQIATRHVGLPSDDAERINLLLERLGLPTRAPKLDFEKLWAAMRHDKKATAGRLQWVLPTRIGEVTIVSDVPESLVREVYRANVGA